LTRYGFKRVSPANLLQPDDHRSYPSRLRGEKWVKECLKPELNSTVPENGAFLFEVARGSMIYGLFFLPLAALATEEGFRVLEAGVRHRCKQLSPMSPILSQLPAPVTSLDFLQTSTFILSILSILSIH
jgi:hypothetical protein